MYHKMPLLKDYKDKQLLKKKHNQPITLQIFKRSYIVFYPFHQRRTHSSKRKMKQTLQEASYDTYPSIGRMVQLRGSITLEMVVVLPLFISFMVFFLFLFRVLLVQESMEEALVYASRTLAVTCFEESQEKQKTQAALFAEAWLVLQEGLKESDCPLQFIQGGAAGISLLSSQFSGDDIILRASYELPLPCVLLGNYSFHFVQCVQSRKWIGNCSLEQSSGSSDIWVYITPHGSVYHCDRTCRYLDLTIRAVNRQSLVALRNADRKIYRKCESCAVGGKGAVYVTDYGTKYHSSLACKSLKRTIFMVKRSQVEGRKECSKCGVRQ